MAPSSKVTSRSWGLVVLVLSGAPCRFPSVASSGFGGSRCGPGRLTVQACLVIPGLVVAKALTEREGLFQGGLSPRLGGSVSRLALAGLHPVPVYL